MTNNVAKIVKIPLIKQIGNDGRLAIWFMKKNASME